MEKEPPQRERKFLMSGGKNWEVCLYSDFSDYQVWCKNFRTLRQARRFMKKSLRRNGDFFCATISHVTDSAFQTFYWTGQDILPWDKSWVLSRRQALALASMRIEA